MLDKDKFANLVIESTDSLYRVSKSILRNDADCEDAVSEAITIAFTKLDSLKREEYAKTWLMRIVIHECFRVLRRRKRVTLVSEDTESVLDYMEHSSDSYYLDVDYYFDLYQAIGRLNEEQRVTIVLYYYEGYSVKEIAKMTCVTPGTVKSRLGRARSQLKQHLKEDKIYVS